jgi:hypothetical protein
MTDILIQIATRGRAWIIQAAIWAAAWAKWLITMAVVKYLDARVWAAASARSARDRLATAIYTWGLSGDRVIAAIGHYDDGPAVDLTILVRYFYWSTVAQTTPRLRMFLGPNRIPTRGLTLIYRRAGVIYEAFVPVAAAFTDLTFHELPGVERTVPV